MRKTIKNLLTNLDYGILNGDNIDYEIERISYDTRTVKSSDLFICLKGAGFDSHSLIDDIIKKGVKAIIVDKDSVYLKDCTFDKDILMIGVDNSRKALAIVSSNYFDNPAKKLKVIGITGTKGKTTTAFMIRNILKEAGHKVGMIGTIGIFYENEHIETHNTTPESYILQEYFSKMLDKGIEYVVMEVSSQSLKHYRVYGIDFYFAIWTNIMPEHIGENEHDDYNDYLNSKLKMFDQCENALINAYTDNLDEVILRIEKAKVKLYEKKINRHFNLRIPGSHNEENASLAYEFGKAIGLDDKTICKALEETVVPGRIEEVYSDDDFKVIVDFSYEGNGAEKLFDTLKNVNHGRIVAVFGCGGNRSKDRRYAMGEVCGKMADFIVLTADNSRFEKTRDIIKDIESTLKKYKRENDLENGYIIREDRREAIEYAIKNRKKGDVICVMGKGHEPYMEMEGKMVRFLDREVILEIINKEKGLA